MKLVPLSLVLALGLAVGAASAGAAPSSQRSAGSFCAVAHGVARDIVNSTTPTHGNVSPTNLRITYTKVAAAEPALLGAAPAPVKANLRPVFGLLNAVIADFKKVNWNPTAFTAQYTRQLVTQWQTAQRPLQSLRAYFRGTCKLDV